MREAENLRARIGLPPVSQIGILVRDLDQTARLYSEIFGIPEFYTYDLDVANHWYYGEKAPVKLRMGKALWGQVEIELIQHVEGDKSLFPGWLAEHGEGLNHLGFEVDDYGSATWASTTPRSAWRTRSPRSSPRARTSPTT